MATIAIIGAGMMGSGLSFPATENGHSVRLCGTHLDGEIIDTCKKTGRHPRYEVSFSEAVSYHTVDEIAQVIDGADMVICGVNSNGVDWFYQNVLKVMPENIPVLSVTKGLHAKEDGTLISFPQYWAEKLGDKKISICAIGGGCISYELAYRQNTIVTYCCEDMDTLKFAKNLMQTSYYHICTSQDVLAIETAVALKNAYTLGIAIAVGRWESQREKPGGEILRCNPQAAMFYQGTKEMYRMLKYLTGSSQHIDTAAGDMYVTIYGGRTRLIGTLLGRGIPFKDAQKQLADQTLESIAIVTTMAGAIQKLARQGRIDQNDYPLMMYMNQLIIGNKFVEIPWKSFTS